MNRGPQLSLSRKFVKLARPFRFGRLAFLSKFPSSAKRFMTLRMMVYVGLLCPRRFFLGTLNLSIKGSVIHGLMIGYPELTAWALMWLRQIRELYCLNRERLCHVSDTPEFAAADAKLRQHVAAMATQRDTELADDRLREPCRKVLVSLNEYWGGLTLFVDEPRIPLNNNYGDRLIRNPAVGRKNYHGSGAERSGRLAVMLFLILATWALWEVNPRKWLSWYFEACAASRGKRPEDPASFLPWNLSETRLADLQNSVRNEAPPDTS